MHKREIRRRLQRIGVSYQDADAVARKVAFQIRSQGAENTARFLKSIGDCLLWYLYQTGQKPDWVRTRHGFPLFLWELRHYDEQVLIRVSKLARVIRLTSATKKQILKVVTGASGPFTGTEDSVREISRFISLGVSRLGLNPNGQPESEPIYIGRQFSKFMSVSGPVENIPHPPVKESLQVLKAWPELLALPRWQRAFYPLIPKTVDQLLERVDPLPRLVGEIHASQEGGAKLRMYAAPHTAIQCVMSPVHDWLADMLKTLPMNCTWDQLRGAIRAQARLKEGFVFSLDLSTATCRFPLSVQLDMVRTLGLGTEWIRAIETISRSQWKLGREIDRRSRFLTWTVGQPLGMRFSMSMFSLAHNCLLAGIASQLGYNPWDAFNVLGDDVVIYHRAIAEVYAQLVQSAGIPISWNKSHQSDKIAEFAGATITRDLVIRPGQFREVTPKNVLELADQFGILAHETSSLSQRVQKLYLFSKGKYTPESLDEYSHLLRINSQLQVGYDSLPNWKTRARPWNLAIMDELRRQFVNEAGPGKVLLVSDAFAGKPPKSVFGVLPPSVQSPAKWLYENACYFKDPYESALYCAWLGLYQSLCAGEISVEEFAARVQSVLDYLHSLLYLPPRSRSGSTQFKKLVGYLLPKGEGKAEAA